MTEHPRIRDLEAFTVGEAAPELAAHVDDCIACRDQIAKLEHERQALLGRLPPDRFVRSVAARRAAAERRLRGRRLAIASGLGGLGIAAAVALLLLPPAAPARGARLKGVGVEIFRQPGWSGIRSALAARHIARVADPARAATRRSGSSTRAAASTRIPAAANASRAGPNLPPA
jgi:hypothetical protein